MSTFFFQLACLLYLLGAGFSLAYLITLKKRLSRGGRWELLVGFGLHSLAILWKIIETGRTPRTNLHESLSYFARATQGI